MAIEFGILVEKPLLIFLFVLAFTIERLPIYVHICILKSVVILRTEAFLTFKEMF